MVNNEGPPLISKIGYTGEDGLKFICTMMPYIHLIWDSLIQLGVPKTLLVSGARDTLRFEAGMPLYGSMKWVKLNHKSMKPKEIRVCC